MYSEECESNNFKNGLAIGIGLGLISGITSMVLYQRKKTLSADQVLEQVKESFLKEGSIEGSWISFEKNRLENLRSIPKLIVEGFPAWKMAKSFATNF